MDKVTVEKVTTAILDSLKRGCAPWRQMWAATGRPRNAVTGKPYRGMNVFILMSRGMNDPRWLTFNQAKSKGGSVRAGEKGTHIVFWKFLDEMKNGTKTGRKIPLMRSYVVFNVSQCDNLKIPALGDEKREHTPIESAEKIIQGMPTKPGITHGGDSAAYVPALDTIRMPVAESFKTAESYYSTMFHELGHSTGHKSRLDRNLDGDFGSHSYSVEELIAEMTAALLSAEAGIVDATLDNSAAYVNGWLSKIQADPSMVISAAGKAQKAADYILGGSAAEPTTSGEESAE